MISLFLSMSREFSPRSELFMSNYPSTLLIRFPIVSSSPAHASLVTPTTVLVVVSLFYTTAITESATAIEMMWLWEHFTLERVRVWQLYWTSLSHRSYRYTK